MRGFFFYTQKLLKYLLSSLVEQNSNISKKIKGVDFMF